MQKSKAALFLMELLIVLLFFSIASAVCIQLFSHAHLTNKKSKAYSDSNIIFTNLAEEFYGNNRFQYSNEVALYYTAELMEVPPPSAVYKAILSFDSSDKMSTCHICIYECDSDYKHIDQELIKYERRTLGDE